MLFLMGRAKSASFRSLIHHVHLRIVCDYPLTEAIRPILFVVAMCVLIISNSLQISNLLSSLMYFCVLLLS